MVRKKREYATEGKDREQSAHLTADAISLSNAIGNGVAI